LTEHVITAFPFDHATFGGETNFSSSAGRNPNVETANPKKQMILAAIAMLVTDSKIVRFMFEVCEPC